MCFTWVRSCILNLVPALGIVRTMRSSQYLQGCCKSTDFLLGDQIKFTWPLAMLLAGSLGSVDPKKRLMHTQLPKSALKDAFGPSTGSISHSVVWS